MARTIRLAQSLELPVNVGPGDAEFSRVLNERMRTIAGELERLNGAREDMGGARLRNCGDAIEGGDAVSRSYADRRYLTARDQAATSAPAAAGSQAEARATQLDMTAPGILGIASSIAPLAILGERKSASDIVALVKQAPSGADLRVEIAVDGERWAEVAIANGETLGTLAGAGLAAIGADTVISLGVTSTGTVFPGADLTVSIRFA